MTVDSGNSVYDSRNDCNAIIETASNTLIAGCQNTVIPNSVTVIGEGAFAGCSSLTEMTVDSGNSVYDSRNDCNAIIETGSNTLIAGCQSTVIPNSVTSICDYAFCGCESLTSVNIPNSVTTIGEDAFSGCASLTSVNIPNSVITIGNYAFYGCTGLTSVNIGNSVTRIGSEAFIDCTSLTSVTCLAVTPPKAAGDCFSSYPSIYDTATLYVPKESVEAYRTADVWKNFTHIVGIDLEPQPGDVNGDGVVNISDINRVIDAIINGDNNKANDVNGDGSVNVSDINIIVQTILTSN